MSVWMMCYFHLYVVERFDPYFLSFGYNIKVVLKFHYKTIIEVTCSEFVVPTKYVFSLVDTKYFYHVRNEAGCSTYIISHWIKIISDLGKRQWTWTWIPITETDPDVAVQTLEGGNRIIPESHWPAGLHSIASQQGAG